MGTAAVFAPAPDFRYVGLRRLEPIAGRRFGAAATALGLGIGVTLAMNGFDAHHALFAGAASGLMSALLLRAAGAGTHAGTGTASVSLSRAGGVRMAIVPWGVLVDIDDAPRILRWAALRNVDVVVNRGLRFLTKSAPSSRVIVETDHDRFIGEAVGDVPLDRLVVHLAAYATEQATPLALDLDGVSAASSLEPSEPSCEALLAAAQNWLSTAKAAVELGLASADYRRTASVAVTPQAVDVLRRVLRDRTPRVADPRAFAAVVAAELGAVELAAELVALTQCPHPIVAAVAKQAARKLGVPRSKAGALDEVAPFLFEADRLRLETWLRA